MAVCCYVITPASKGVMPSYCGKRVGWRMVKDDDNNSVRKYNSFCDEHQARVDAMPHDPDDDYCNCKECR